MDVQRVITLIEERIKRVKASELVAAHNAHAQSQSGEQREQARIDYQVNLSQRVILEGLLAEIKGEKYTFSPS